MGAAAQSRTLSWHSSTYTATASHSSNLLIGLLLSIGIPVIGYFTLVRLKLAECKGQATSLSGSCKPVIHQLSSAFTRMSKCSETLMAWISFAMSVIYPQTVLSSYLKNEEVAMESVTCLLVGTCWGGRRWGGLCWLSGGLQLLLGSAATCCPTPAPLAKKYSKQTNILYFINDDFKGKEVLPTATWKGWAHLSHWYWHKLFYICTSDGEKYTWKKTRVKAYSGCNTITFLL